MNIEDKNLPLALVPVETINYQIFYMRLFTLKDKCIWYHESSTSIIIGKKYNLVKRFGFSSWTQWHTTLKQFTCIEYYYKSHLTLLNWTLTWNYQHQPISWSGFIWSTSSGHPYHSYPPKSWNFTQLNVSVENMISINRMSTFRIIPTCNHIMMMQ